MNTQSLISRLSYIRLQALVLGPVDRNFEGPGVLLFAGRLAGPEESGPQPLLLGALGLLGQDQADLLVEVNRVHLEDEQDAEVVVLPDCGREAVVQDVFAQVQYFAQLEVDGALLDEPVDHVQREPDHLGLVHELEAQELW